jgi:hypothetical protein
MLANVTSVLLKLGSSQTKLGSFWLTLYLDGSSLLLIVRAWFMLANVNLV